MPVRRSRGPWGSSPDSSESSPREASLGAPRRPGGASPQRSRRRSFRRTAGPQEIHPGRREARGAPPPAARVTTGELLKFLTPTRSIRIFPNFHSWRLSFASCGSSRLRWRGLPRCWRPSRARRRSGSAIRAQTTLARRARVSSSTVRSIASRRVAADPPPFRCCSPHSNRRAAVPQVCAPLPHALPPPATRRARVDFPASRRPAREPDDSSQVAPH